MKLLKSLKAHEEASPSAGRTSVGKVIVTTLLMGLMTVHTAVAYAACRATINGQAMTAQECRLARQIYGYVEPGDYLRDSHGNWVKIGDPNSRGNIYRDAQRPRGSGGSRHWSDGEGLTRTPFGSVGGGYYLDNDTGSSYGP
jgi:hypothetical protein